VTDKGSYCFILQGEIVPKARPRFSGGRTYLPAKYRDWKTQAIEALRAQWELGPPIAKASVTILVLNQSRGDIDNIAGAVLDALVQAGVVQDDRLSCISELTIMSEKTKDREKKTIVSLTAAEKSRPPNRIR
jgi:Holliday junction resolvase RusA-like endonuclease